MESYGEEEEEEEESTKSLLRLIVDVIRVTKMEIIQKQIEELKVRDALTPMKLRLKWR